MQLAMVTVRRVLLRPWTDATLSGIAAQSPVPVHLTVDVPERLAPTVEAVGYLLIDHG
jgi:hypothetical protein